MCICVAFECVCSTYIGISVQAVRRVESESLSLLQVDAVPSVAQVAARLCKTFHTNLSN